MPVSLWRAGDGVQRPLRSRGATRSRAGGAAPPADDFDVCDLYRGGDLINLCCQSWGSLAEPRDICGQDPQGRQAC
jgi:hypothetical protein